MKDTAWRPRLPNRLSVDPRSPHHVDAVFQHAIGTRLNGGVTLNALGFLALEHSLGGTILYAAGCLPALHAGAGRRRRGGPDRRADPCRWWGCYRGHPRHVDVLPLQ